MRRKKGLLAGVSVVLLGVMLFASCYGSFALTHKLYNWNGKVGDKFVNTAVMWVMMIIPVYSLAGTIDFLILNTLEFWTGSNPLAMKEGNRETQVVSRSGQEYHITASPDRFDVCTLSRDGAREAASLVFDREESTWYAESSSFGKIKVSQAHARHPELVSLFDADGNVARVVDLND
jgi:hypothetical protein